jgi:magnesium transporter
MSAAARVNQKVKINPPIEHLDELALPFARQDFTTLAENSTVEQALAAIRSRGVGERVVYFYVVDEAARLVVVPICRRPPRCWTPNSRHHDSQCDCDSRYRHRDGRVRMFCAAEFVPSFTKTAAWSAWRTSACSPTKCLTTPTRYGRSSRGHRFSRFAGARRFAVARVPHPVSLGRSRRSSAALSRAFLSSAYELTLAKSLVLAFFLTMILGLNESVSIQSMTMTIEALRAVKPTRRWYLQAFRREAGTALLLGLGVRRSGGDYF